MKDYEKSQHLSHFLLQSAERNIVKLEFKGQTIIYNERK